ncbi:MAG TPA: WYL domain-containing transcriptional regulator [Sphaerochaeta sp.]|nr:WYL domain-containing transcriptional regulator [Sphaerochaeta sp.]HPZ16648.1 WYL domain-containing transcriptional regulator [Sphaerochaeta sp.]
MAQLERILYINRMMEEAGGVTTAAVMARFEVSRRQVVRDIAYLRERLGAPIAYDEPQRRYIYTEPFSPLGQSNGHLLVLKAIVRSLAEAQGMEPILIDGASEALGQGLEEEYRVLERKITFRSPVQDWPDWQIFGRLLDAMKRGLRITLSYKDSKGSSSRRHIEALRLINYSSRWYLLAYDLHKREIRTFHLARVVSLSPIEGDWAQERFSDDELDALIEGGYGIFLSGDVVEVSFRATGWAAEVIATQTWHPDQQVTREGEGALVVTLPVTNLNEILSALLYYGPNVSPIAPPSFVALYADAVKKMQENLG